MWIELESAQRGVALLKTLLRAHAKEEGCEFWGLADVCRQKLREWREILALRHDALMMVFETEEDVVDYVMRCLSAERDYVAKNPTQICKMWVCEYAAAGMSAEYIAEDTHQPIDVVEAVLAKHADYIAMRKESRIQNKTETLDYHMRKEWAAFH